MTEPLPRSARGKRPRFHADPAIDRLIAMVLTLTQELSVTRDRLDSLEALAEAQGWLATGALESYAPDPAGRQRREARREELLARVFEVMRQEIEELEAGAGDSDYWRTVEAIEQGRM